MIKPLRGRKIKYCLSFSKMADQTAGKGTSVSFTFSKKKTTAKLVQTNKEYRSNENETESDKDFIHSAEGKVLKRYLGFFRCLNRLSKGGPGAQTKL